ncbi:hypothetical protein LJC61_00350 [Ruminococcaceae bacterium OttesenSCG-928-A16]|nr:hypothetical protein [Ruminococcaceae bacterium OttesenSCG-928-A16]
MEKNKMMEKSFDDSMHRYGRAFSAVAIVLMLLVPVFVAFYFKTTPNMRGLLAGLASICLIYLPSSIVEVVTYAPMLGTGATYLAFITGNLTNLKIPCAMSAREIVGTEFGTKENEIVSTLSVAVSSLVTCGVLAIGVLLLVPLTPVLSSPVLQPAFSMVVPALFGALGYKYFSKTPLVAVAPFVSMVLLCLLVPAAASQVAVLVPVSAVISIAVARLLYKKGKI